MEIPLYHKREGYAVGEVQLSDFENDSPFRCAILTLEGCANDPDGFQYLITWVRDLRDQHGLRTIAIAAETTGIYYWALWDFLGEQPDVARVLYNPRTTEHMGEVLSKKVRDELVDALLLAE